MTEERLREIRDTLNRSFSHARFPKSIVSELYDEVTQMRAALERIDALTREGTKTSRNVALVTLESVNLEAKASLAGRER